MIGEMSHLQKNIVWLYSQEIPVTVKSISMDDEYQGLGLREHGLKGTAAIWGDEHLIVMSNYLIPSNYALENGEDEF